MERLLGVLALALAASGGVAGRPVDNRLLSDERDGANWLSYGRTFSENHFSPLAKINVGNVGHLNLAWAYDLPPYASVATAPIAVEGVLYFAVGYSVVHAMDAKSGELLWKYDPEVPAAAGMKLRGGWGSRGIAFWGDKVYTATHDGRVIAIDAKSGKPVWTARSLDPNDGRYITGPPWAFNGKIAVGHGGADYSSVRGFVDVFDAETGNRGWRFYTVPGNPKGGFENSSMAIAAQTWKGEWWKFGGGGTVWNAMAYDPEFNRLYIGTGNGSPWNRKIRSPGGGDNLFLCSIVALDADTGSYVWHYQVNPGETWDYNAAMDIELATLPIEGKPHRVLLHAPKNGFFYVIDRETGKLISAEKFAKANWAERIDTKTGRPVENPLARFPNGEPALVYPGPLGAHSIQAMSFNPAAGLAYIPVVESAFIYSDPPGDLRQWSSRPGMVIDSSNAGIGMPRTTIAMPPMTNHLLAWDPIGQREVWRVPLTGWPNGGTATTAGNLVFQGRATGEFDAYAADTGKLLWKYDAQAGINAHPITYLAGGKQYVTVIAGFRGFGGPNGSSSEWEYRSQKRRVLTFALDGAASLLPKEPVTKKFLDDPTFEIDPLKAASGAAIVREHCVLCHGHALVSGGTAPDLRASSVPLSQHAMKAVLHDGVLVARGMPRFQEFTPDQIEALQHYIRQRAREALAGT